MKWACLVILLVDLLLGGAVVFQAVTAKPNEESRAKARAFWAEQGNMMQGGGFRGFDASGFGESGDEGGGSLFESQGTYDVTDDLGNADYNKTNQEGLDEAKAKIGRIGKKD